ncbi:MAG TPA: NADP-dependent oxidoreductase, partial [Stellaceae bacterium]|nr:NADP-dependent oxidoreductase [Stellaceae bacterium]
IARIVGCRVVGIAGGLAKCRQVVEEFGFDGAIDYKNENVGAALDRLCPGGIDVAFESVGGMVMDAVFDRLNTHGRMALCGLISGYNEAGPIAGPRDFGRVLMRRLSIRGFIIIDYLPRAKEGFAKLAEWVADGRIKWKTDIVEGLENAPAALNRLFTGQHDGKLLVKISEP